MVLAIAALLLLLATEHGASAFASPKDAKPAETQPGLQYFLRGPPRSQHAPAFAQRPIAGNRARSLKKNDDGGGGGGGGGGSDGLTGDITSFFDKLVTDVQNLLENDPVTFGLYAAFVIIVLVFIYKACC
jgi:hypothetical protein